MNSAMTSSRKMKLMAGITALVATLFTAGGTLALADGYARTAVDGRGVLAANSAPQYALAAASVAIAD